MLNKKSLWPAIVITLTASACTTTTVIEEKAPLPQVPEYVKTPHPAGFDLADLRAIFISPLAPKDIQSTFADTCDDEFKKLTFATQSPDDRKKGAFELVTQDPERMHWCFYVKISKLQETLQGDTIWSDRQKRVLETFQFLSPIANAFMSVYHDSRYLRWATQYYTKISEWVFYKKLGPTPENTLMLTTGAAHNLEPWIAVQHEETHSDSVFAKYGISMMPTVAGAVNPFDEKPRVPASESTVPHVADLGTDPSPAPTPQVTPTPSSQAADPNADLTAAAPGAPPTDPAAQPPADPSAATAPDMPPLTP